MIAPEIAQKMAEKGCRVSEYIVRQILEQLGFGHPKSLDHDFATFSDGQIVPHGIYDVTKNVGYMTIGTSHDTPKFVCDNIERVWNEHLRGQYPGANTK